METREYRTVDKSAWGPGPWQDEPDKRQWQDEATGLPCLIVRNPAGALCGYVGVSKEHPAFGLAADGTPHEEHRAYMDATRKQLRGAMYGKEGEEKHQAITDALNDFPAPPEKAGNIGAAVADLNAHGGVNFANQCSPFGGEEDGICHVPGPGETDEVWWFGFDCSHAFDLSPGYEARTRDMLAKIHSSLPRPALLDPGPYKEVYRDFAYVVEECRQLAKQLAELAS